MSKAIGRIGSGYATQEDMRRIMDEYIKQNPLSTEPIYSNGVQYAQNNLSNIATDAQFVNNPNYISDEDLYARMWKNVKRNEGSPLNPYLDTKGYITVGAGANINNKEDFMKINFMIDGRPATDAEKEQYYNKLQEMSGEVDENNQFKNRNIKADKFADYTPLRISDEYALSMAQQHMKDDLAHVRREFADFDSLPIPLKEVLLDIHYNTGDLNRKNWPHLFEAIERRDVFGDDGIVKNVHRKGIQQERNDWAERMARSISF